MRHTLIAWRPRWIFRSSLRRNSAIDLARAEVGLDPRSVKNFLSLVQRRFNLILMAEHHYMGCQNECPITISRGTWWGRPTSLAFGRVLE